MSDNPWVTTIDDAIKKEKCAAFKEAGLTYDDVQLAWSQLNSDMQVVLENYLGQFNSLVGNYGAKFGEIVSIVEIEIDFADPGSTQESNGKTILEDLLGSDIQFSVADKKLVQDAFEEDAFFEAIEDNIDPFAALDSLFDRKKQNIDRILKNYFTFYGDTAGASSAFDVNAIEVLGEDIGGDGGLLAILDYNANITTFKELAVTMEDLRYARTCKRDELVAEFESELWKNNVISDITTLLSYTPGWWAIKKLTGFDIRSLANASADAANQAADNLQNFEEEDFSDLFGLDIKTKEQCFLLANILNLAKIKERIDDKQSNLFPTGSAVQNTLASADSAQKQLPIIEHGAIGNRSVMITGDTFGFVNSLTQSPDKGEFFEMTNAEISALMPMIRLYKVTLSESDSDDGEQSFVEKEVEIKFDTHTTSQNIADMLANKGIRNPGVGLKSFNFTYEGNNPFSVKKSISAKLVIHANSFSELLQPRNQSTKEEYRYVDLALKTGSPQTIGLNRQLSNIQIDNLEKLNFRLKAVVGWQNPMFTNDIFAGKSGVLNGINNSAITLNLTPTIHDFAIDDIGRVTFTINYLAYVEEYYDNSKFNIFSNTLSTLSSFIRKLALKQINRECDGDKSAKYKKEEGLAEIIEVEKENGLRNLFTDMIKKRKIYFFDIDFEEMEDYAVGGLFRAAADKFDVQELESKIKTHSTAATSDVLAVSNAAVSVEIEEDQTVEESNDFLTSNSTFSFFYASDLIDNILENLGNNLLEYKKQIEAIQGKENGTPLADALEYNSDNSFYKKFLTDYGIKVSTSDLQEEQDKVKRLIENFQKLRIMLGPVEVVKPASYDSKVINLGDIPISTKHFMEWLTNKMLKKEQAEYYLTAFLNDFFNVYIIDFMKDNTCYAGKLKQRISLFEAAFTEYRDSATEDDTITKLCKSIGRTRYVIDSDFESGPILKVMGVRDDPRVNGGLAKEINYLAFFAGLTSPLVNTYGDKEKDRKKGIWHYQIGKSQGIVKNINLSKTDSTGLAEVRFEQDGFDGLKQLRVLYDTTIKSYLDVGAFPGSYIYVDPRGFDPSGRFDDIGLDELGIGGYCMLWKTEHVIQPGLAESTLHAKWVASKDSSREIDGGEEQETQKCTATRRAD